MTDSLANSVYVCQALDRYPKVFSSLMEELMAADCSVHVVTETRNIWCRDYFPVQVAQDRFVKFRYIHDDRTWPQLYVSDTAWQHIGPIVKSDIVLDGGNVVRHDGKVLMTEIVFEHNPGYDPDNLHDELERLLDAQVIFLPVEPDDPLGHADGVVKWIDANTVFVNAYQQTHVPILQDYGQAVRKALNAHNIECEPFPFAYQSQLCSESVFRHKFPDADAFAPARGYWINLLHVKGLVLYPMFGISGDSAVRNMLEKTFRDCLVAGIDCDDLSWEGGVLHCVTAAYQR
jgi:agmatine/peptidylarginine deiminase